MRYKVFKVRYKVFKMRYKVFKMRYKVFGLKAGSIKQKNYAGHVILAPRASHKRVAWKEAIQLDAIKTNNLTL